MSPESGCSIPYFRPISTLCRRHWLTPEWVNRTEERNKMCLCYVALLVFAAPPPLSLLRVTKGKTLPYRNHFKLVEEAVCSSDSGTKRLMVVPFRHRAKSLRAYDVLPLHRRKIQKMCVTNPDDVRKELQTRGPKKGKLGKGYSKKTWRHEVCFFLRRFSLSAVQQFVALYWP